MDRRSWTNPSNFYKASMTTRYSGRGYNAAAGMLDYDAFMGAGAFRGLRGAGVSARNRNAALGTARVLGGIGRMSEPLSRTTSLFGRNVTYGRLGMTAGLGMLALRNGANMVDRMRYGDYGGAMMSGALTAAAGYGAYSTWMYKGALRSHFNNAASWLLKRFS